LGGKKTQTKNISINDEQHFEVKKILKLAQRANTDKRSTLSHINIEIKTRKKFAQRAIKKILRPNRQLKHTNCRTEVQEKEDAAHAYRQNKPDF